MTSALDYGIVSMESHVLVLIKRSAFVGTEWIEMSLSIALTLVHFRYKGLKSSWSGRLLSRIMLMVVRHPDHGLRQGIGHMWQEHH